MVEAYALANQKLLLTTSMYFSKQYPAQYPCRFALIACVTAEICQQLGIFTKTN